MSPDETARQPAGKVLVVDDSEPNATLLRRHLTRDGYAVAMAGNGETAIATVTSFRLDVILLDIVMPGISGFDVCRRLKADPSTRLTPVVLVTGLSDRANRLEGINAGADDFLSKPYDLVELKARVNSLARLKHYTDQLDSAEAVIVSLAQTIEARDAYTLGHCQRLASYATALGADLGLARDEIDTLERGGYLHDVGKIGVPDAILLKNDTLTDVERTAVQQHTLIGDELCSTLNALQPVRPIVRHHHERLDGSGYPDGLKGDQIPLVAQIVGVADVFDALTTERPYRRATSVQGALVELRVEAGRGWRESELVERFASLAERGLLERSAVAEPQNTAAEFSRRATRGHDIPSTMPGGVSWRAQHQ